jgi:predicted Zn finger-like uncharacterized protein
MIITCPSCSTRYAADSAAIGAGRTVRCARCGNQWHETPKDEPREPPPLVPPPRLERSERRKAPPAARKEKAAKPKRRRSGAAGWAVLILLIAGLAAAGYVGREQVVRFWPPAIKLYQELGVDVAAVDLDGLRQTAPGLFLRDVISERVAGDAGPVLRVRGSIVNESGFHRAVPPLSVTLIDGDGSPVAQQPVDVAAWSLAPGETTAFEASLDDVDGGAAKLVISNAAGQ